MATSFERDFLMLDGCLSKFLLASNTRRIGVHEINQGRRENGEYHHLFHQLKRHPERFHSYMRMSVDTFDYILKTVESKLMKSWNNWHEPILPEERLVVTLKFLITGVSYRRIGFEFRMGASTVGAIVSETIDVLWEELQPLHMPVPTRESFRSIADDFSKIWNFPNCIGALGGKHWGILDKPIKADTELVDRRVKCVCILHNAIIDKDGMDHNYTETEQTRSDSSVMWNRCGRPSNDAKTKRDIFTAYFTHQPLEYRES
ncbi:protein antagonist of like heterochromatin protein 1 [Plakobranchus ocellatus]|uniref:Protein antagonist of like heterochromatin protein 1 n=1 Tax=Plakobranchus ocellatus TaxID=259542 RepID=A0AAV4B7E4_9GAST|nr:protein antagonist of like heterochromatin protein 1 [Plakobranchus ocellatus]